MVIQLHTEYIVQHPSVIRKGIMRLYSGRKISEWDNWRSSQSFISSFKRPLQWATLTAPTDFLGDWQSFHFFLPPQKTLMYQKTRKTISHWGTCHRHGHLINNKPSLAMKRWRISRGEHRIMSENVLLFVFKNQPFNYCLDASASINCRGQK